MFLLFCILLRRQAEFFISKIFLGFFGFLVRNPHIHTSSKVSEFSFFKYFIYPVFFFFSFFLRKKLFCVIQCYFKEASNVLFSAEILVSFGIYNILYILCIRYGLKNPKILLSTDYYVIALCRVFPEIKLLPKYLLPIFCSLENLLRSFTIRRVNYRINGC